LAARPGAERVERCVRSATDEVELAVAQSFISLRDREKKLDRRLQPLFAEVAEFDRGDRRKIRRRDHVGYGDAKRHGFPDSPLQRLVPDALGLRRFLAEALDLVRFVFLVVAGKETRP